MFKCRIPGVDPDIEEGGAYIEWFWCSHVARAASAVFLCVDITQGVVGGSGGSLPRKNFEFRLYKSVSEAIKDHHKHAKFMATGL